MKFFALLFFVLFLFCRLTSVYIDELGKTKISTAQIKTGHTEAGRSEAELKRAMRYHGVLSAQENEKGEWCFVRDGKRCKVFGEAYLVHIINEGSEPAAPVVTARHHPGSSETREITTTALSSRLLGSAS